MLAIYLSEISNKEGVFTARLTLVRVNALDMGLEGMKDHGKGQVLGGSVRLAEASLLRR